MKIHFIRHAKTNQQSISGKDFDRELLPRGKRQCVSLLSHLQQKKWNTPTIYCSSSRRTTQTFEALEGAFVSRELVMRDIWYLCSKKTILDTIWETERRNDLLFIGHNFGISDAVSYLTGQDIEMATAEYICLEFPIDQWMEVSIQAGTIADRFRPLDR